MQIPDRSSQPSSMFKALRAGYISALVWYASILTVAFFIRVPGKGRPGTYFAHDVGSIGQVVSFALFFMGAAWSAASQKAYESAVIKWSVCAALAVMVLAQLFWLWR